MDTIDLVVVVFMLVMGIGIAALWTLDIARSPEVDRSRGLLRARDRSTHSLLLPHWLAEYATACLLIAGAISLAVSSTSNAAAWFVPLGLGALGYTSLNSLGWTLADRSRRGYAAPMLVGLGGAVVSIGLLLSGALLPLPVA